MKNMTLRAMTKACGGQYYGDEAFLDKEVGSITIDSRKVEPDGLFIAIKGERSDGHTFIKDCYDKGALCVISEHVLENETHPYIKVESSLQALKDLALLYRSSLDVKVVGITGSVGKTSTKETISAVLSQKYKVLKTLGNYNNEIGLPLTVFRLKEDDEVAVLEMGISDFGEMERLTAIARPDICVITNIGLCHLENLKTRDGILKAKTEIFKSMNPEGTVILNGDDDKLITVNEVYGKNPVFFGISYKDGVYADNIENLGLEGSRFLIHGVKSSDGKDTFEITIPVPGRHMIYNAMAAACVGACMGLTSSQIAEGISHMETIAGRNNIIKTGNYTIIDDCYNANPVSMKASVDVLSMAVGRKVCILGDMFELGDNEKELHYDVGEYLGTKNIDILVTIGNLSRQIALGTKNYMETNYKAHDCKVYSYETKKEFMDFMGQILCKGDNILIKASHGMAFTEIVKALSEQ
ncbi:MAG: UDP-N-acetylmuramoyl-tripeptide--D-alanyl-D-alanine ligase [Lachnospira sp.]